MGRKRTHGRRAVTDRTYRAWINMRSRCRDPHQTGYKNYGGRGISVCSRWHVFENFLADMGEAIEGYSLDRIDPDGNYEPSNCRWASFKDQIQNRRKEIEYPVTMSYIYELFYELGRHGDAA